MKNYIFVSLLFSIISFLNSTLFSQCTGSEPALFLGNDTVLCPGSSLILNAPPTGYDYYNWSNNTHLKTMTVTTSGLDSVEIGKVLSTNLVVNGDFESGNSGFSSSYFVGSGLGTWGGVNYGPLISAGSYLVTDSIDKAHLGYVYFKDHTAAPGTKMMVVNGSGTPNSMIWSQTITVTPNSDYMFGAWVATAINDATNFARLQFFINGVQIGPIFNANVKQAIWDQFTNTWNSSSSTSAVISIYNQNTVNTGNDFALDDITFKPICKKKDVIKVTFSLPNHTATILPVSTCNGVNDGQITINSTIAGSANQYSFDNGATWQASNVKSGLAVNSYIIKSKSPGGCIYTSTVNVTAIPTIPTQTTSFIASATCSGSGDGEITITSPTATQYSFDNGLNWQAQNVKSNLPAGPYIVVSKNSVGCTVSSNVQITSSLTPPTQTVLITPTSTCNGVPDGSITITCATATEYSFDAGSTWGSSNVKSDVSTGTYTVLSRNSSGCTVSEDVVLTSVIAAPVQTVATTPNSSCTLISNGSITITSATATDYSFDGGGTWQTSNTKNGLVDGSYSVESRNASGCTVSETVVVASSVVPLSISTTQVEPNLCSITPNGEITITSLNASDYSFDGGQTWQTSPTKVGLAQNTYAVQSRNLSGCIASESVVLTGISSTISLSTSNDVIACHNETVNFNVLASGGTSYTYVWDDFSTSSSTQSFIPSQTPAQTKSYGVKAVNSDGCTSTKMFIKVTVLAPLSATVSSDVSICPNQSTTLSANTIQGGVSPYTVVWTKNSSILKSDLGVVNSTFSTMITGDYIIGISDNCSTPGSMTYPIKVSLSQGVQPSFSVDLAEQCTPAVFTLSNKMDPSKIASSIWRISDGAIFVNQNKITYNSSKIGDYGVKLIVTTVEGCKDSVYIVDTLKVLKKPIANFSFTKGTDDGENTSYKLVNTSFGANSFDWKFNGKYTGISTDKNPEISLNDTISGNISILLVATAGGNCSDSLEYMIKIPPALLFFAPNSFSPNGDGVNDVWTFSMSGFSLKDFEISIWDRWGALVWKSTNSKDSWDGIYNSNKLPVGTYNWTMLTKDEISDQKYFQKGVITLIR